MGGQGKAIAQEAKDASDTQLRDYKAQQVSSKAAVEKQKQAYKEYEIKNPYAENVYEDLTVNQQQAQFQAQQGAQQRANIMGGLRGAAGSSGIAGLAQAMANQGQLQTQQISASIGAQEAQNQKLAAKGQLQVQSGEAMVQQAETGRASTLLGMEYGELAGANAGVQAAYGNQQSAIALDMQRRNANVGAVADIIGSVVGGVGTVFTGAGA